MRGSSLFAHGVEQVLNHLVAGRGDTDALARDDGCTNHPRTHVRLPRTGRSLNGQRGAIEQRGDPNGEVGSGAALRLRKHATAEARRTWMEQVGRGGYVVAPPESSRRSAKRMTDDWSESEVNTSSENAAAG